MNENLNNKYFIVLKKKKIFFSGFNNKKEISLAQKYDSINCEQNNLSREIEKFFNDNLIKIERDLNDYIKSIIIIVDLENTLSANLSIKLKLDSGRIDKQKINELLITLKNQFSKYSNDYKIIHMVINKLLIDGEEKDLCFISDKFQNLILEVNFECLKKQIISMINNSLFKYQISVKKIFVANYLKHTNQNKLNSIISVADKIISEGNKNEVIWINKKPFKPSFFEKFFTFFD